MESSAESKRVERVVLACVQCRSRHVKCDATQPICIRCQRDGKECVYQKSRRGGLDKAALARRRLRLQQEAERAQQEKNSQIDENLTSITTVAEPLPVTSRNGFEIASHLPQSNSVSILETQLPISNSLAFQVSSDRLLELFFENFWPSFPIILPLHFLQARQFTNGQGLDVLLPVLHWIGSIYAPSISSEPFYHAARAGLEPSVLVHSPFNVQALMLFALAEFHQDMRIEAQKRLEEAISMALELRMNERGFARAYGQSDPVLEEAWRRTFYILCIVDQHFAIVHNKPVYTLLTVSNQVDLPCDDDNFEAGVSVPQQ
jgi:hypothetical protein